MTHSKHEEEEEAELQHMQRKLMQRSKLVACQVAAGTQKTYLIAGSTPSVTASSNMEIAEGSKAMSLACCCASSANWVWPGDT